MVNLVFQLNHQGTMSLDKCSKCFIQINNDNNKFGKVIGVEEITDKSTLIKLSVNNEKDLKKLEPLLTGKDGRLTATAIWIPIDDPDGEYYFDHICIESTKDIRGDKCTDVTIQF